MITGLEDDEARLLHGVLTDVIDRLRDEGSYLDRDQADRIEVIRDKMELRDECPYTHAHTRHWCGYPDCRDS